MAVEEEAKEPGTARRVLAWLGCRVSGAVFILVGVFACILGMRMMSIPTEEIVEMLGEDASDFYVFVSRTICVMPLLAGVYLLGVGVQLCRGKLALFADLRGFVGGNLTLAAACVMFWEFLFKIREGFPYITAAGLVYIAAGGLWLWIVAKLLRGNQAPVADLRLFVGGNAALGAAMSIMLAGISFIDDDGMLAAGGACVVAGIALFALAAKLLRVAAKRERDETGSGQVAEERA